MLRITLPDGAVRSFDDDNLTILEVAHKISPSLAKVTIAGIVNNQLVDASYNIAQDSALRIITEKDPEALEIIRHSTAHLLAMAVKELFPTAQIAIGPVITDGFYHDFSFERSFTPEDLVAIERKMEQIAARNLVISRLEMTREDAIEYFNQLGESYKFAIVSALPNN